ncbi:MAG: DUF362 domain-containing protein [Phycisphaerales bacterium]|nr:MAG: DUF362 domain-containing protein [Phycisphaerales bacterium]
MPVSRRDFLKRGGATLIAAGAAAGGAVWLYDRTGKAGLGQPAAETLPNYFAGVDYPVSAARISVARGVGTDFETIDRMVRAAVGGLGGGPGLSRFIDRGDVVLVKPNVGFERAPRFGATTDPQVVRSVIRLCNEAGASRVIVADNPIESAASCFARSGIAEAVEREGARVMIPARVHFTPLAIRPAGAGGEPYQPDPAKYEALGTWPVFWAPLREADKVIGVPAVKDHNLCHASMGMKNWYGLLGGRRNQFHQAIHNIVSDLGFMMSPTLMIADGVRVMMRNGPTGGSLADVKAGHTIVASVDQLACDAWCYQNLLERDPAALRYLDLAQGKYGETESGPRSYARARRFGTRDWKAYRNRGLIVEANV